MKRIVLLVFIISFFTNSLVTQTLELKGRANDKLSYSFSQSIPKDAEVILKFFGKKGASTTRYAYVEYNGEVDKYPTSVINKISFRRENIREFWQFKALKYDVYDNIADNGIQYDLRKEMEEDAIDYLNQIKSSGLVYVDTYLEDYLYRVALSIYPYRLEDGRPGILNITILKETSPNAFIFPNGTLVITTGMLSTINSESELIGIMAHEISHFVLDHGVINVNKATARKKRAEFWAGVATGIAAAGDIYMASQNENYTPGVLTASTAVIAYSVASIVIDRLGLKYSRQQETEADECAVELMKFIESEPTALSSVFKKIRSYSIKSGDYLAISSKGTHPSLTDRINKIGEPGDFYDPKYEMIISTVTTFNSFQEYYYAHFDICTELTLRNIKVEVATEDDYMLQAMAILRLFDTKEKNGEVLNLLNTAKSIGVNPRMAIYKHESIVLLRLDRKIEAKQSLNTYQRKLEEEISGLESIKNEREWSFWNQYYISELEWSKIMQYKIDKL